MRAVFPWAAVLVLGGAPAAQAAELAEDIAGDVADEPLDPETIALLESLAEAEEDRTWPVGDHVERSLPRFRLLETLAPTVADALELLPTLEGSARGRLGPIRRLDGLRVEPSWARLGRLDPALYGDVRIRRGPSAAAASRTWVSEVALAGREASSGVEAAVDLRTADRAAGAIGRVGAAAEWGAVQLSASVRTRDALRVKTGTTTRELPPAAERLALSARARLLSTDGPLWLELGYDFDGTAPRTPGFRGEDLHLAQVNLRFASGAVFGRATAGHVAALGSTSRSAWVGEVLVEYKPPRLPVAIEVGGLVSAEPGRAERRLEAHVGGDTELGPLAVGASARLSEQQGGRELGLAGDARAELEIVSPVSVFVRYARSFEGQEVALERVDLIEGGPRLAGSLGWVAAGVWAAWLSGEERIDGWGVAAEGALELDRFAVAGSLSRAEFQGTLGPVGPAAQIHGRLAVRLGLVEWSGFAEIGLRGGFDAETPVGRTLLPGPPRPGAPLALDLRGEIRLVGPVRMAVSLTNGLDHAFVPFGRPGPAPGLDLRVRLAWRPG